MWDLSDILQIKIVLIGQPDQHRGLTRKSKWKTIFIPPVNQ